jgi:hypothetical protein
MGWRTGRPASLESVEISAAPPVIRQTSVVAAHVEAQDLVEPQRGRDMGGGG